MSRRVSGESERAGGPATFGYEGKSSPHDDEPTAPNDDLELRIARVGAIAPSQPTGGADREGCFVLSWRAGAPTGGTSRDTAPAASGRRRRTQRGAPRPGSSAPPPPYRPPT